MARVCAILQRSSLGLAPSGPKPANVVAPPQAWLVAVVALCAIATIAAPAAPPVQPFAVSHPGNMDIEAATLPPPPVCARGAFAGLCKGTLILAGGAKDIPAEENLSRAAFSDAVYFLDTTAGDRATWTCANVKLPTPAAFGACVVAGDGLICLGGWSSRGTFAEVTRLSVSPTPSAEGGGISLRMQPLPPLPEGLAFSGAAVMDGAVYVVGGCTADETGDIRVSAHVWKLELGGKAAPGWSPVPFANPDGTVSEPLANGAILPLVNVRRDEFAGRDALYVFGGWRPTSEARFKGRPSCWRYVPGTKSRNGCFAMPDLPADLRVGSSAAIGPAHMLAHATTNPAPAMTLSELAGGLRGESLFLYHTYTATWVPLAADPVPRQGVWAPSDGTMTWVDGGDAAAGVASSAWTAKIEYAAKKFGWVDLSVIALYMLGMVAVGEYFRRREKNTEDFFMGGRKIPWWAAGLSIWATGVSAISYMAIPAKTYAFDWSYISLGIWPILTTVIAAYLFIPLLRRLRFMSITEYVEMRFGRSPRVLITLLTLLGGVLGRGATVLLLPSMALSAVTGLPVWISILGMGAVTTLYTVTGGMSAVVWTDVAQTIVMFGGVLLALALVVLNVDGGLGGVITVALDHDKLRLFDFAWDFSIATFWVFGLWAIVDLWGKLSQEGLQRAFSTKDVASARKAMLTCAWVSIPGTLLFFSIGTALFAFYKQHPENLNPNLPLDSIFPLFIMQQMPAGVAGLVIAGIFAAAMSTLSGMNSAATIVVQDCSDYVGQRPSERTRLIAARWVTLLYGVLATAGALYMSTWKIASIWDTFSKVMSLLGGGLGCLMVLALCTRRGNTFGVWVGTIVGTIALWCIELFHWPISFFIYGTISTTVACVVGYVVSVLTGGSRKNLDGLTLWTLKTPRAGSETTSSEAEP